MSTRTATSLAYALAALALAVDVAAAVFLILTRQIGSTESTSSVAQGVVGVLTVVSMVVVGTLVAARRSRNATGWVFLVFGLATALSFGLERYAVYTLIVNPGWGKSGTVAASLEKEASLAAFAMLLFLLLLFPSGRFSSSTWRWLGLVGASTLVGAYVVTCIRPGTLGEPFEAFVNPLGIGVLARVGGPLFTALLVVGELILLAAAVATILRFRRSRGVEREQFKWFALAAALFALVLIVYSIASGVYPAALDAIAIAGLLAGGAGIPIAVGIAILKYRLYEIDRIINRTLVYGAVTALLAGLYFAIVIGLQAIFSGFTRGNDLAIAGSTLAVAALFRPVRRRIQAFVDRRFYRRRYDAQQTLDAFSTRLRDEVDLDQLGADLGAVVYETMQPAHVSFWIRPKFASVTPAVTISGRSGGKKDLR